MNSILNIEDKDKVIGEIYKITNITNGKIYIGQTRSHRLNRNKYRPFGYLGRFNDHVSEANSNKKNCSRYLNYALRKYGTDSFTCQQIHQCNVDELDELEKEFIIKYNSKYPNGYNLTCGGKGFTDSENNFIWETNRVYQERKLPGNKSEYTKNLISRRIKEVLSSQEMRMKMMKNTQQQHLAKKFEMFNDVVVNCDDVEKYIRIRKNHKNNTDFVIVMIDKKRVSFVGKYETIDDLKNRAIKFIHDLKEWQRSQIAGNPLEPQTTTP